MSFLVGKILNPKKRTVLLTAVFFVFCILLSIMALGLWAHPVMAQEAAPAAPPAPQQVQVQFDQASAQQAGEGIFGSIIAKVKEILYTAIGYVLNLLIAAVGSLLNTLSYVFFKIITYNNFIYEDIVTKGWAVTRDVANMFFILILLFISIATILSLETYSYRRALPRLVLMAIVINFSKVICGIIIDFAQVFTLTFATVISESGLQTLYQNFGVADFLSVSVESGNAIKSLPVLVGLIVGLLMLVITLIIVFVYAIIFLFRVIMLWILVILAPLAFLLRVWPGPMAQRYAAEWIQEFKKYVVIGPVMVFFLWLALTATSQNLTLNVGLTLDEKAFGNVVSTNLTPAHLTRFLVACCLLVGGLKAAQQSGVAGSGMAGAAKSRLQRLARAPLDYAERGGRRAVSLGKAGAAGAIQLPFAATAFGARKLADTDLGRRAIAGAAASRIPFLNRAAVGYADQLQKRDQKLEDEAAKKAKRMARGDPRVGQAWANQMSFSRAEKMAKEKFKELRPEAQGYDWSGRNAHDTARMQEDFDQNVAGDKDAIKSLKDKSWYRLGAGGVDLTRDARTVGYLTDNKNKDDLAAVIQGMRDMGRAVPPAFASAAAAIVAGGGTMPTYRGRAADPTHDTKFMSEEEEMIEELEDRNLQFQQTRGMVARQGMDFFESEEYRNNPEKYVTPNEFERLTAAEIMISAGNVSITGGSKMMTATGGAGPYPSSLKPETGVTLGTFGSGGRLLAAGFEQLRRAMGNDRLPSGGTLKGASGLNTKGEDAIAIAGGLKTILTGQLENLKIAATPEDKVRALKEFGYKKEVTDYTDEELNTAVETAKADGQAALKNLSNNKKISENGINIINKDATTFKGQLVSAGIVARHEVRGHEKWDAVDPDMRVRQSVYKTLSPEERKRMRDRGGRQFEEQVANAEGGMLGDDEMGRNLQAKWRAARESVERARGGEAPYDRDIQAQSELAMRKMSLVLGDETAGSTYDARYKQEIDAGTLYSSEQMKRQKEAAVLAVSQPESAPERDRAVTPKELAAARRKSPLSQADDLLVAEVDRRSRVRKQLKVEEEKLSELSNLESDVQTQVANTKRERDLSLKRGAVLYDQASHARDVEKDNKKADDLVAQGNAERENYRGLDDDVKKKEKALATVTAQKNKQAQTVEKYRSSANDTSGIQGKFKTLLAGVTDREFKDNFDPRIEQVVKNRRQSLEKSQFEAEMDLKVSENRLQDLADSVNPDDRAKVAEQQAEVARQRARVAETSKALDDFDAVAKPVVYHGTDEDYQRRLQFIQEHGVVRAPGTKAERKVFEGQKKFEAVQSDSRAQLKSAQERQANVQTRLADSRESLRDKEEERELNKNEMNRLSGEALQAQQEGRTDDALRLQGSAAKAQERYNRNDKEAASLRQNVTKLEKELTAAELDYAKVLKRASDSADDFTASLIKQANKLSGAELEAHAVEAERDVREYQELAADADYEAAHPGEAQAQGRIAQAWSDVLQKVSKERELKSNISQAQQQVSAAEDRRDQQKVLRDTLAPGYQKDLAKLNKRRQASADRIARLEKEKAISAEKGDVGNVRTVDSYLSQEKQTLKDLEGRIKHTSDSARRLDTEYAEAEKQIDLAKARVAKATEAAAVGAVPAQRRERKFEDVERVAAAAAMAPRLDQAVRLESTSAEHAAFDEIISRPEAQASYQEFYRAAGGQPDLPKFDLFDKSQYFLLVKALKDLSSGIANSGKVTQSSIGTLAAKVYSLSTSLPDESASQLEIRSALELGNATQDDIRTILQDISRRNGRLS